MTQQAFVLRISPSGFDRVPEALEDNQIIIGWAAAEGLLDQSIIRNAFRSIISEAIYSGESNLRKAGAATGHMWRFIREMNEGDLVVVPYSSNFFVARVTGPATFLAEKQAEDTAYRRDVAWLNNKNPIPRSHARSALISRMKTYGTCASATDLLEEIEDCLGLAKSGHKPTFRKDLEDRLVQETLAEIRTGRLDPYGFEHLVSAVLRKLGASESRVIARSKDEGADVVATFLVAGTFQQTVVVQAKHFQAEPPIGVDVVEQLISGIDAESADLGMIMTSGTISDEAIDAAKVYFDDKGVRIELIDGEQFAKLIIEHGIGDY